MSKTQEKTTKDKSNVQVSISVDAYFEDFEGTEYNVNLTEEDARALAHQILEALG